LYWSHHLRKSVFFSNPLKFILFFPDSPHTYAQHNTNKHSNFFPLVTETFQILLSNNTYSGTNKTKLQATFGLATVLPHSLHLNYSVATFTAPSSPNVLNQQQARAHKELDVRCRSHGVLGVRLVMWRVARGKATRNSAQPIIPVILKIISITVTTVTAITVRYTHYVINCEVIHSAVFQRYQFVTRKNC